MILIAAQVQVIAPPRANLRRFEWRQITSRVTEKRFKTVKVNLRVTTLKAVVDLIAVRTKPEPTANRSAVTSDLFSHLS